MRQCLIVKISGWWLAVLMLVSGCGSKSPDGAMSNLTAVFSPSAPALKAKADLVAASFKTNDYVGAVLSLRELQMAPGLAPTQQKAVQGALDTVMTRLFTEAARGDPQAVQARDILRKSR